MAVDERLLQMLIDREFDRSDDGDSEIIGISEGVLDVCDYNDFYRQISSYGNFSLRLNSIGFIVGVYHAEGDYWVLAFPYSSISELLNPQFNELAGLW